VSAGLRNKWRKGDKFLVRHKDRSVVVVEKRAGLLTVPIPSKKGKCLRDELDRFLGHRSRVRVVHRLDRVVSGLLVFARNERAKERLIEQFAAHETERQYMAAVQGVVPDDEGTFESWLRSDPHTLRMFSDDGTDGKHAVTHWEVKERLGDVTLVEVRLETGARNQIRVHFSEAGFPLLGEKKYLDPDAPGADSRQGHQRLFLHAERLGFVHPTTNELMRFEAPLPPDLNAWLRKLRA